MPQYVEVKGQTIEFPDGMPMAEIEKAVRSNMLSIKPADATQPLAAPKGPNAPNVIDRDTYLQQVQARKDSGPGFFEKGGTAQNVAGGLVRGAGSIGSTLLRFSPIDKVPEAIDDARNALAKLQGKAPIELRDRDAERRASMTAGLGNMGADTDSTAFAAGKLGGEIMGTAGAGGLVGNGLLRAAPAVAKFAPPVANAMTRLAPAVASAGFTAGGAGMGTRAAGGAISGAVSSGMVGDNPLLGGAIGGVLPPALKVAGAAGVATGRGIMAMLTPQQQGMAAEIAKMTGKTLKEVLQAVQKHGLSILNIRQTIPQILQDDAVSQLQRSAINAGDKSIMARESAQNVERMAGFDRVAPTFGTVNEAADSAGNMIGNFGKSARANKSEEVRQLFDAIDPFGDTAIELPIEAMKASKGKFLGVGTFGKGNAPSTALQVAEDVGTELLPPVAPITQNASGKTQSLEQAVRSAGGIRGGSGELKDLGIKQSGTTGLVNNKTGKAADLLAEDMFRRGFLPDNDPATLFDMLRNGQGRKVFANDATEGGMQRGLEQSMGDAPGAERIMKRVSLQTVQNFRGSLNEAWKDASMRGRNQEAAALKGMISDIDNKVNAVSVGKGNPNEAFPGDVVQSWKEALAAHGEKKARFDTGPQARMFRQGGDGQAAIQGAEIPREFFNGRASQIEDAQAFKRLTQGNPQLAKALKSYAITDAAQQTTKDGMLSASKLTKWADSRSGALKETMSEQDMALLNELIQGVKQADSAATGGMAKGSNSIQNAEAAARFLGNGILDSRLFDIASTRLPLGGFGLDALRKSAKVGKAEKVGGLLSDPEVFAAELQKFMARNQKADKISGLLSDPRLDLIGRAGYRAAPVLMGD
jgi:hypothetical protein